MSMPSRDEIKLQLQRVFEGREFKRSKLLRVFLKYVVEKELAGAQAQITGYNIGIDVFSKAHDFDINNDSAVRVEAIRLRKALALYYHDEGRHDPIIIKVPKGGYRPVFLNNTLKKPTKTKRKNPALAAFLSVFIFVLIAGLAVFKIQDRDVVSSVSIYKPTVVIGHFNVIGDAMSSKDAIDFSYELNTKFLRFNAIRNIVLAPNADTMNQPYDYLLEGTLSQSDGHVILSVNLIDTQFETSVWNYNESFDVDTNLNWMEDAAILIVSALGSTHGVIDNFELNKYASGMGDYDENYKCILDFRAYDNNKNERKHAKARICLEALVKKHPDYSIAWAYLSWVYADELRNKYNVRQGDKPASERALYAGLQAVEANQGDARSHMYLASAAFWSHQLDLMERHMKISIELNPYDTDILASAAWKYATIDRWDLTRKYGEQALKLNPSPPKWYHGGLFCYYYYVGSYEKALFHALSNFQEDYFQSYLYLIVAHMRVGQVDEAKRLAKITQEKYADLLVDFDTYLMRFRLPQSWDEKLLTDLTEAGLTFSG